ncbi:MAG: DUF255 domain-containing protein, partial [Planctomycetota bacterium]|nr:DUF255 domain-containing protein [Planctomycetota bacterium]
MAKRTILPQFPRVRLLLCALLAAWSCHCELARSATGGAAREGTFVPPETAGQPPALVPAFARRLSDPAVAKGPGVVQWRAWQAQVFAEAARADRPVLLFVTANWCHWGKVMERATFSDGEVAARLNEQFIAVRLD